MVMIGGHSSLKTLNKCFTLYISYKPVKKRWIKNQFHGKSDTNPYERKPKAQRRNKNQAIF